MRLAFVLVVGLSYVKGVKGGKGGEGKGGEGYRVVYIEDRASARIVEASKLRERIQQALRGQEACSCRTTPRPGLAEQGQRKDKGAGPFVCSLVALAQGPCSCCEASGGQEACLCRTTPRPSPAEQRQRKDKGAEQFVCLLVAFVQGPYSYYKAS